jgi:hypothetical protein
LAGGYGDINLTAPADFQISTDNTNFQSSVVITAAEAVAGKTLLVLLPVKALPFLVL